MNGQANTVRFPVSVLCVDDEPTNLDILTRILSKHVETLYFASNGRDGHVLYLEKRPDIVLTDLIMPVLNGLEMSCMIRATEPKAPIILLTSCNGIDFLAEAIDIGITQYLPKPILKDRLLTAIQRCYEIIDLERRLKDEQERSIAQLLSAQKLESLGVLAGGVAHNFNNILTAILGNVALATMNLPQDSPAAAFLNNIEKSAIRAADIAQLMMDYSGRGFFLGKQVDLNVLLRSMQSVFESTIPKKINTLCVHADPLYPIKGDAAQLRQVVMALILNAVEAMGDDNGTLHIATGCEECDRGYLAACCFNEGAIEGRYAFLEVSDTGCGMDSTTIAKLFDPFYSTKFTGRGMGMAALSGIVRWHGGAIHIISKPGVGTAVKILLPAIPEPVSDSIGGGHG